LSRAGLAGGGIRIHIVESTPRQQFKLQRLEKYHRAQRSDDVPPYSVILFEDIDCTKTVNARIDPDEWARHQTPIVMTTNKIETLDQALLRPGRIDYRLYLGKAAEEQKIELYRRFFPRASMSEAREFVETYHSAETMAEFQGLLLGLVQDRMASPTDRVFQEA
jgi:SpoVK/Ycf46/Vps4 family AAA+-type ATPase